MNRSCPEIDVRVNPDAPLVGDVLDALADVLIALPDRPKKWLPEENAMKATKTKKPRGPKLPGEGHPANPSACRRRRKPKAIPAGCDPSSPVAHLIASMVR